VVIAAPESTLLIMMVILLFGLVTPELSKRIRIPFVTSLILIGAILGPHGLGYVYSNEVIDFFGFLGMTFLMLIAGLETDVSKLKELKGKIFVMASLNGLIPFLVGGIIIYSFGYPLSTSLLVGVIFISSSVAVIVPSLKAARMFNTNVGQIILASVLLADVASLIALSFFLQKASPITSLPLLSYFVIVILSVVGLFFLVPRLTRRLFNGRFSSRTKYEKQLRYVIVLLIGALIYFSALGVHPILASFLVGLALARIIKSELIFKKINTLGYGLFVPIFLFIVGMEMDLSILVKFDIQNILMISIVLGLILSKFLSGILGGRIVNLRWKHSLFFGSASIIQLTTTLAVVYAASTLNLLDSVLITSIIILSVITTIIGPILLHIWPEVFKKED